MIAMDRGRMLALGLVATSALGAFQALTAEAQQGQQPAKGARTTPAQDEEGIRPAPSSRKSPSRSTRPTRSPSSTASPITRQQLADECVARRARRSSTP